MTKAIVSTIQKPKCYSTIIADITLETSHIEELFFLVGYAHLTNAKDLLALHQSTNPVVKNYLKRS